ncbi:uncharacterized protein EDB93DRAFT_553864 [Suillus bovinus]|uniref:uncharacterized protein n=1 Tax=Suillus bovinus TaxID=48563 RepID=UPI001B8658D1|nr:uncharacterized protein EDB93DRAFT_553864 [Suillus bovinus]KAG2158577.1 hypothetical protein EDB93DRAFT_553864 [Suillus bovinus]
MIPIPLRFLTISYGNKRVVTQKGPTSKAHHPLSSLRFRTTCNFSFVPCEDDSALEVDEEAWEEEGLVDLVCCLEVYLEEVMPGPLSGEEASQPVEGHEDAQVHQQVRGSDERQGGEGECSDIAEANDNVEEDEARDEDEMEGEQDKEQEKEEDREGNEQSEESEESTVRTRPYS